MKTRMDKLVIVDLEATCDNPRPSWLGEIIEVGVCLLDLKTLEVTNPKSILVKPLSTPITPFCTQLTTLTPEIVNQGGTLLDAMSILHHEYKMSERIWASWGDYDRKQLVRECGSKGFVFPGEFSPHLNLKRIFAVEYGFQEEGMDSALNRFGLKLEGTHHRGCDDAVNIARLYRAHLQKVRSK